MELARRTRRASTAHCRAANGVGGTISEGGWGSDEDHFDPASRTQREEGYHSETGLSGGGGMGGLARYVAVAPRAESTGLCYLDFGA